MTYTEYKERIEKAENNNELEAILKEIENDFENISDRKYVWNS